METITTITFPRPTPALLSMNDRGHWRKHNAAIKAWRQTAGGHALPWGPFGSSMVCVTLDVPDARRRDPANFFPCVKAIVDGLVDAGWWPDDTPQYVTVIEPTLRVVKARRVADNTYTPPLMVTVELRPR